MTSEAKVRDRLLMALTELPGKERRLAGAAVAVLLLVTAGTAMSIGATTGERLGLVDVAIAGVVTAALYLGAPGGIVAGLATTALISPLGPAHPALGTGTWLGEGALATFLGFAAGGRTLILDRSFRESRLLCSRLDDIYTRTLHVIAEAVELRDPITAGHSRRVAVNARTLGERLGLAEPELDILYWAGLLHDLGKLAVPEAVLQKSGTLSPDEWALIRRHPAQGGEMIARVSPDLAPIADAVSSHHEWWNGAGYPRSLAGTAIPLAGRILAVVDVFEALTSQRPYRSPLSISDATEYISSVSSSQLDSDLVVVFEQLLAEGGIVTAPSLPLPSDVDSTVALLQP